MTKPDTHSSSGKLPVEVEMPTDPKQNAPALESPPSADPVMPPVVTEVPEPSTIEEDYDLFDDGNFPI